MSKYIIIAKNKKPNGHYCLFVHTVTKLINNEAYFSLCLEWAEHYAIEKDRIPFWLKTAQRMRTDRYTSRKASRYDIFVIKLNSPKLQQFIEYNKTTAEW